MSWKRKSTRWNVDFPCKLLWESRQESGRLIDLSTGGAFVETARVAPVGTLIRLVVSPGDKTDFNLEGVTAHSGSYEMEGRTFSGLGLRFTTLSKKSSQRLQQLIKFRVAPRSRFALPKVAVEPGESEAERLRRRQHLQRIVAFFEESTVAYYIIAEDGGVMACNAAAHDLLGYETDQLVGLDAIRFFADGNDWDRLVSVLRRREHIRDYDIRLLDTQGGQKVCRLSGNVRRGVDGTVLGYQFQIHELSDGR